MRRPAQYAVFQINVKPDDLCLGTLAVADVGDSGDKASRRGRIVFQQGQHIEQGPQSAPVRLAITNHHIGLRQSGAAGNRVGTFFLRHERSILAQHLPFRPDGHLPAHLDQGYTQNTLGTGIAIDNPPLRIAQNHSLCQRSYHGPKAGFAGSQRHLGLLARRDIGTNTAVTNELSIFIKQRFSADAQNQQLTVRSIAFVFEIAEGLMFFQLVAMVHPGSLVSRSIVNFPSRFSNEIAQSVCDFPGRAARYSGKSELLVELPIPIRGQVGQTPETRLAAAHLGLSEQTLGDIFRSDQNVGRRPARIFEQNLAHVNVNRPALGTGYHPVGKILSYAGSDKLNIGRLHAIRSILGPQLIYGMAQGRVTAHAIKRLGSLVPDQDPESVYRLEMDRQRNAVHNVIEKLVDLFFSLLSSLGSADVARGALVTGKLASFVKYRYTADRVIPWNSVTGNPHEFEISKGLTVIQNGAMGLPRSFKRHDAG